jgi:hypothetical protein
MWWISTWPKIPSISLSCYFIRFLLHHVTQCETILFPFSATCCTTFYPLLVLLLHLWRIRPSDNLPFDFNFETKSLRQLARLLEQVNSPSKGCYLYRATQTYKNPRQTSILLVGFEPTISVFRRAKNFHDHCDRLLYNFVSDLMYEYIDGDWGSGCSDYND